MPDAAHDDSDFDADRIIDEAGHDTVKSREETPSLIENLRGSRIFFYPACGHDWNPLHHFTHLCDTFVYCDYNADRDEMIGFERELEEGGYLEIAAEMPMTLYGDNVNPLATPNPEQADDFPHVEKAFGKFVRLTRKIGSLRREIRLFYFRAEGATLYRNLFTERSIAPRIICLKQCQDGFGGQNWTNFLNWDGPLARQVWENRVRPELIVSQYEPNDDPNPMAQVYNWPWRRVWQEHEWPFGNAMTQLMSYVLPGTLPPSAGSPMNCHGVIARNVKQRRIGERTIIKIKKPPCLPGNIPDGAQFQLGRDEGRTLEDALACLTEGCVRERIEHVHSVGCYFEDEAPALYEWKWKTTFPKTLTIHCETEGDLACYGPAADEIVD